LIVRAALIEIVASWIASIASLYADTGGALTASGVGRRGAMRSCDCTITRNRTGPCYCETA
jgi:hypothetical protein